MTGSQYERQLKGVEHLTEHFHEAPVWIVACIDHGGRPGPATGASMYPAVQNILLAARALGLGATLTTRHTMYAAEVDAILGLPENVTALAIVPIGYPDRGFSRVRRVRSRRSSTRTGGARRTPTSSARREHQRQRVDGSDRDVVVTRSRARGPGHSRGSARAAQ